MAYTYILKCNDGTFYTGYTTNLERRVHEHNHSVRGAKYTKSRRPCKLVYYEEHQTKSKALKREYWIKQRSRYEKKRLITFGNMEELTFGQNGMPFYELSPYYIDPFTAQNKNWGTLIQFWAANAGSITQTEWKERIRFAVNPQVALNRAKSYGFKDFDEVEPKIFLYGLQEKFRQHKDITNVLLLTGKTRLVYVEKKGFLGTNNRYGELLMKIREKLM